MKTIRIKLFLGSIFLISGFFFTSCEKNNLTAAGDQYEQILSVSADGTSTVLDASLKSAFVPTVALSETELSVLAKMKAEEKLARDVYTALSAKLGGTIFSRISEAENRHMNAIVLLLENYGVKSTIGAPGVFEDQTVTSLYNTLVAKGSTSMSDSYSAGALIEEMDIKDLMDATLQVKNENVLMVFENLTRGSRNHLRAFNLQLKNLGVTYHPVYLDSNAYQVIANSQFESGKQYRMNNGNGTCTNGYGFGK